MGGGGGSTPAAPPLVQNNVAQIQSQARSADVAAYNRSDADYAQRFPQLVQGRAYNINNAVSNLNGQQDPSITSAFQTAGLGDKNLGNTEAKQSRSLGQPILAKEQRDSRYFQTLLSHNPQRAFGLSGGDVTNLALANVGAQNAYNQSTYGTRIAAYNQSLLQDAQSNSALIGALGSLGSAGIKAYGQSQQPSYGGGYYDPSYYPGNTAPAYMAPGGG